MGTQYTGSAVELPTLFSVKEVVKLTDAAQALFGISYDLERAAKKQAKSRIAREMAGLDLFGPSEHYRNDQDYRPGDV